MSTPLLTGKELLQALFSDASRPSERWLRHCMRRKAIPYVKIGRRVFFDRDQVAHVIETRWTIQRSSR